MTRIILGCLLAGLCVCCGETVPRMDLQSSSHDLVFETLADRWDEAVPLGNGEVGVLVWQRDSALRFSLDRVDLWDLRPMPNFVGQKNVYQWIRKQWDHHTYDSVQRAFDDPYNLYPAPSKIPAGALEFDVSDWGAVDSVRLLLKNALCKVWWKDGKTLETFVHASEPYGWFRIRGVDTLSAQLMPPAYRPEDGNTDDGISHSGLELKTLGYEQGTVDTQGRTIIYRQEGWQGFRYAIAVSWKPVEDGVEGLWSVMSNYRGGDVDSIARRVEDRLQREGFDRAAGIHQRWWDSFWACSSIQLPDTLLEKQWYLEQYKFGSTARADLPPISLQAIWTADNGKLPPWKGDFHHDLNTQLSYWPAYSGNHLAEEAGFTDWLWLHKEVFERYARDFFGAEGLNVPGVTTLDGEPMGGWIQYSGSPTVGAWLSQHFYWRWRYTRDRDFLAQRAYPWLAETCLFLEQVSEVGEDGIRRLPLSSSPEIFDNRREAWFPTMTNYDLGLVRFAYAKAAELARELGREEEAMRWDSLESQWGDYAVDENGLMFAATKPYDESHRHFSHQMAFHPLGLLDVSQSDSIRNLLETTVNTLERVGPSLWTGYSYSWMGGLCARLKDGDRAARYLRDFAQCFCLKNSFHVNGDQSRSGKSDLTYRPFTLEGNMAFAASLQEMLLQSHSGVVEIFPAVPTAWKDVSFHTLRAEGAFLISARMQQGQVVNVEITSITGGLLRLRNPFDGPMTLRDVEAGAGEVWELPTEAGETLTVSL